MRLNLHSPYGSRSRQEHDVFEAFCRFHDYSAREREILRMLLDGEESGNISKSLLFTESTVEYHIKNILCKAGSKNCAELRRKYWMALYPALAN